MRFNKCILLTTAHVSSYLKKKIMTISKTFGLREYHNWNKKTFTVFKYKIRLNNIQKFSSCDTPYTLLILYDNQPFSPLKTKRICFI
jgi:hypothetical protein